ncbi:MAG: ATP-binding protein [Oligoflexia bacterium]|nr:ATP-binding protein [Oligoflexia bacterium]
MVFLGGPRQVGKTTLSQTLLSKYYDGHPAYFNWDLEDHRNKIKKREWPKSEKLIIFDEIHKFKNWRNLLKGYYDTLKNTHSFLITGSARLDHYRKGGDSLLGRYFYYRLHPYSLSELGISNENLQDLMTYGGFPEPLSEKNIRNLHRWHRMRLSKLIRTDLRDLENVKDIDKIELLAEELPRRIGSPLSLKSIAEYLEIDPKTVKSWIEILSSLYYSFQVAPYGAPKIRAVKKEKKLYLWDWSQIENEGVRFENLVASHLLKYCHHYEDVAGDKMELRYIRDTDKREVDFVVIKNKLPLFAVECKLKENSLSPHIPYFKNRTKIPRFYQVHMDKSERQIEDGISIVPFVKFCEYESIP